jgi:hypothetical protein
MKTKIIFSTSSKLLQFRLCPRKPTPYSYYLLESQKKHRICSSSSNTVLCSKQNLDDISSIDIPSNTEILCISYNRITSFTGFPDLHSLVELDMCFNRIQNFADFPQFPQLEKIDLSHNPVAERRHFRISLIVLQPKLKFINGTRISKSEKKISELYQQNVCDLLRNGWEMTFPPPSQVDINESQPKIMKKEHCPSLTNKKLITQDQFFVSTIQDQEAELRSLEEEINQFQNELDE